MRLLVAAVVLASVGLAYAADPVEVEVKGVRLDPASGTPVVLLSEKAGSGRSLPIWIGPLEAEAILVELDGIVAPRPLTHDLMKRLVEVLGARLDRVVVTELVEQTYRARLDLERAGGERLTLDARPSDAIALALRFGRPILVEPSVFSQVDGTPGVPTHAFGVSAQDLTPELAEVLAVPEQHGAVVTDVDPASPARKLHRADVVTGVDGEAVSSAGDLMAQLERRTAGQAMQVTVRREGQPVVVRLRVTRATAGEPPHRAEDGSTTR
jgi:bifunctional DNase/RNase